MVRHKSQIWYTVYNVYRDRLIVIGYSWECAAFIGCSVSSFQSIVSNVKKGKNKTYCIVVENLKTGSYAVYGSRDDAEKREKPKKVDECRALELYIAGNSDSDIANQLLVSRSTIRDWRKRNNLLANMKQGRPKK